MTVDELLARKREVLAQRRAAEDSFEAFFLNEELRDLNARLRALRGGAKARRTTNSGLTMDRERYLRWVSDERDDEVREAHRVYIDAVRRSAEVLTDRQREIFDLWRSGVRVSDIAQRLGVDKSTVSRTLTRGKARLREEAGVRTKTLPLDGMRVFDLADEAVARVLLSCLTDHQAVCIYLYYGEWLNLRECGELLGIDHTAVLRTVQRGLLAIQKALRCGEFTLDNADALGELAYELYLASGAPSELPQEAPKALWARRKLGYQRPPWKKLELAACTVRTSDGLISRRGAAHHSLDRPMSRLLPLLYELRQKGPLYRWLARLFGGITKRREKRA